MTGRGACTQERLFDQSDAYRVHVCERCGLFAVANLKKNQFHCPACKSTTGIVQVTNDPCLLDIPLLGRTPKCPCPLRAFQCHASSRWKTSEAARCIIGVWISVGRALTEVENTTEGALAACHAGAHAIRVQAAVPGAHGHGHRAAHAVLMPALGVYACTAPFYSAAASRM